MIDKLIEQQETIKGMQENEESAIKIMKMYEDYKLRVDKAINILELSSQNKGICTQIGTDTIQSALSILKGDEK